MGTKESWAGLTKQRDDLLAVLKEFVNDEEIIFYPTGVEIGSSRTMDLAEWKDRAIEIIKKIEMFEGVE